MVDWKSRQCLRGGIMRSDHAPAVFTVVFVMFVVDI